MLPRTSVLSLAVLFTMSVLLGCNALNPICGSSRPAPAIGSLSPSTLTFAEVQNGALLIVNGSHFVSSSEIVISGKIISTTVISDQQLRVMITTSLISGPGAVNVSVHTPGGNAGDLGCTSGGDSSVLVLTIT